MWLSVKQEPYFTLAADQNVYTRCGSSVYIFLCILGGGLEIFLCSEVLWASFRKKMLAHSPGKH